MLFRSIFKSGIFSNKILIVTVVAGVLVNVLLALTPLASAFGLTGLTAVHWFTALGIAFSVIPVGEMYKLVLRAVTRRKKLNLKIKSAEA